ncbi:MAG: metal-dependent hydrolase [Flavobacteriales bacterium]
MKFLIPVNTPLRLALLTLILLGFCLTSDYLITNQPFLPKPLWGLYDGFVHGSVGVMVMLPLLKELRIKWLILFFLCASLVDIDHFIAAKSFSVSEVMLLPMRPPTHSFTFAFIAGSAAALFFKKRLLAFWIVFGCLASHVIRDASSGVTPMFYPADFERIPVVSYLLLEGLILYISYRIAKQEK